MSKQNVNVQYTKTQLKGFGLPELLKLDLYKRSKIEKSITLKNDIIEKMISCQDKEKEKVNAGKAAQKKNKKKKSDAASKKEDKTMGSDTPVFHRSVRTRNRMTLK